MRAKEIARAREWTSARIRHCTFSQAHHKQHIECLCSAIQIQNSWTHTSLKRLYRPFVRSFCSGVDCAYVSVVLCAFVCARRCVCVGLRPMCMHVLLLFVVWVTVCEFIASHDVASKIVTTISVYTRAAIQRVRFISYFSLASRLHSTNTTPKTFRLQLSFRFFFVSFVHFHRQYFEFFLYLFCSVFFSVVCVGDLYRWNRIKFNIRNGVSACPDKNPVFLSTSKMKSSEKVCMRFAINM